MISNPQVRVAAVAAIAARTGGRGQQEILGLPIQDPRARIEGQQPAQAVYIEQVTISTKK